MKQLVSWFLIIVGGLSLSHMFKVHPPQMTLALKSNPPISRPTHQTEPLNLNTASLEELDALPGIGPVIARRIIEYREQHGLLTTPEDLLIVEGISERRYQGLVNFIQADNPSTTTH